MVVVKVLCEQLVEQEMPRGILHAGIGYDDYSLGLHGQFLSEVLHANQLLHGPWGLAGHLPVG